MANFLCQKLLLQTDGNLNYVTNTWTALSGQPEHFTNHCEKA